MFKCFLILLFCCVILFSCSDSNNPNVPITIVMPANYGENVYYFNCTGVTFGKSLVSFLKDYPHLEVSSITGDGTFAYGKDRGYFVTFKERNDLK